MTARVPPLRLREVRAASDPAFPSAYRLLRRSFPEAELLPRADWVDALEERAEGLWTDIAWHLLVATRGRKVVGAASGNYLGNLNVGIVGYIAVASSERGGGVGVRLRRALVRMFQNDARRVRGQPLQAVVGEVHADNPWLRHLVQSGAIALDFPYYQPSLSGRGAVPLVLYYQPMRPGRRWLTNDEVRRLLYSLWRRPYRIARPLSRPAFRKMLRALGRRRRIGFRKRLPAPAKPGGKAIAKE